MPTRRGQLSGDGRMSVLIDPNTKKAIDGAIKRVDDYTVDAQPAKTGHFADRWHGRLPRASSCIAATKAAMIRSTR